MNTKKQSLNANRSSFYLKALPSAILAACLLPAVASSANLLIGADSTDPTYDIGSFEKATLLTGVPSAHYPNASTAIKGWTVETTGGKNMDITDNSNAGGFLTINPKQMVDLADIGGFGRKLVSVPVAVTVGQRYRLSFIIGNHSVFRSTVGVSMTGGTWSDTTPASTKKTFLSAVSLGTPTNDWRTVTVDFIATAATTQITFSAEDPGIPGYPRQVAGFPRTATIGETISPTGSTSVNPDGYAYPAAIANKAATAILADLYPTPTIETDVTGDGISRIPRINFDENITLDQVSLDLVPTAPNLVTNGSFETDEFTGGVVLTSHAANSATLTGWTVGANGAVEAQLAGASTNAATASQGTKYLDLAGTGGFLRGVTSAADITVVAGKTYTLSFDLGSYAENFSTVLVGMTDGKWADTNTSSDSFASINNAKLFFNHVKPIGGANSTNWQTMTVTWVAGTTGKTKISIVGVDPNAQAKLAIGTQAVTNVTGGTITGGTSTTVANLPGAVQRRFVIGGTPAGGTITGTIVDVGPTFTTTTVGGTVTGGTLTAGVEPLTNTSIVNKALPSLYAQNYSDNILLDNVMLQEAGGALAIPVILTPTGTQTTATPTFTWDAVANATSYKLTIGSGTPAVIPAVRLGCATAPSICTYKLPQAFTSGNYTALLQAINATDTSSFSTIQSFTIPSVTVTPFTDNTGTTGGATPNTYDYINAIQRVNISNGNVDGTFGATTDVTRAQMAAFIIRALEGEPAACTVAPFTDVPLDNVFCKYIKRMKDRNITQGIGGGLYNPSGIVPREQMAAFIVRAVDGNPVGSVAPTCATTNFGDVPTSSTYCGYIQRLAALNVTQGCQAAGGGLLANYCPTSSVTRGAMAAFVSRAFLGMN